MKRALICAMFAAVALPAGATDDPCKHAARDPEFTACWQEQFKKSEAEIAQRLKVLAARHRKEEPALHGLVTKAQQAFAAWREAACRVETFESKGTQGFSVYWDKCRIKMNQARIAELQKMIDEP